MLQYKVRHIFLGVVLVDRQLTCAYCLQTLVSGLSTGQCACCCYRCEKGRYGGCVCSATQYQCIPVLMACPSEIQKPRFFFPTPRDRNELLALINDRKVGFEDIYSRVVAIVTYQRARRRAAAGTGPGTQSTSAHEYPR